jgi:two-component system nitrate/nitrite response regulator NarL
MASLRVLVVADDPLVRAGLAALIDNQPGCDLVGQAPAEPDLADQVIVYRPDVLVWDLGWDPSSPPDALDDERLRAMVAIVALLPDDTLVPDLLAAGVRGLLRRDTAGEELAAAVAATAQGLVVIDPILASAILSSREQPATGLVEELTPRELEVLQLLAEGLSNKVIARRLEISEHTVKFHVNAILGKLGVQSRTEAVVHASRLGLIIL